MQFTIIDLEDKHLDQAGEIWNSGWREGHAAIVPVALTKLRTLEDFRRRLVENQSSTRVAVVDGKAVGFYMLKDDEIYQLYVAPAGQGSGIALALVEDGQERLLRLGFDRAWLACAVGNQRAARFYAKIGWENIGAEVLDLETSDGTFPLEVWRFEKALTRR